MYVSSASTGLYDMMGSCLFFDGTAFVEHGLEGGLQEFRGLRFRVEGFGVGQYICLQKNDAGSCFTFRVSGFWAQQECRNWMLFDVDSCRTAMGQHGISIQQDRSFGLALDLNPKGFAFESRELLEN